MWYRNERYVSTRAETRAALLSVAYCVALLSLGSAARAVTIASGDLLVTNSGVANGNAVIHVDPATGAQSVMSSGGLLLFPRAVACTRSSIVGDCQRVLVVSNGGLLAASALVSIEPSTGAQSLVTDQLSDATGLAVSPQGDVYVSQAASVVRVDLVTGAVIPVSSFGLLSEPDDLVVDANGDLLLVDQSSSAALIKVDTATGLQSVVLLNEGFEQCLLGINMPMDLVVEASGSIAVAQNSCLWRYDPFTGIESTVSQAVNIGFLQGIDVEVSGDLVVADSVGGVIRRVNPITGAALTVTGGGAMTNPTDVFVAVPEPGIAVMSFSAATVIAWLSVAGGRRSVIRRS